MQTSQKVLLLLSACRLTILLFSNFSVVSLLLWSTKYMLSEESFKGVESSSKQAGWHVCKAQESSIRAKDLRVALSILAPNVHPTIQCPSHHPMSIPEIHLAYLVLQGWTSRLVWTMLATLDSCYDFYSSELLDSGVVTDREFLGLDDEGK